MADQEKSHFVGAAIVAAELYNAMIVARDISLTASNAKALALRAGNRAMGFRALTDFIDVLAKTTIKTSREVNALAVEISRIASESARLDLAIDHFKSAIVKSKGAKFANDIQPILDKSLVLQSNYSANFNKKVRQLKSKLSDLGRDLRSGMVLSTMSKVEATQVGIDHIESLNNIAEKVEQSTEAIRGHVIRSQQCFSSF